MTSDGRRDSLADQAAAWVPPWERPVPVSPIEPAEPVEPVEQPAAPVEPVEQPAAPGEPVEQHESADPAVAVGSTESLEPVGSVVAVSPPPAGEATSGGTSHLSRSEAPPPATGGPVRDRVATASAQLNDDELRGALEAILLVVDEPVAEVLLAQTLEQPVNRVRAVLEEIAQGYTAAGHGFELRRAAGGWRLYTRPEYAGYVERFVLDGQSVRLTQAALETLAVVAYKQPVTRSRISAIRGVNCDGVVRTLVSRGLIEECGTEPDSGAFLYRTTTLFLEKLGLDTLAELPPLAPFLPDDVEELTDAPR